MKLHKVEDPRQSLERLTRKEIEYIARLKGFDLDPAMPKQLMLDVLEENGIRAFRCVTDRGLGNPRLPTPPYDEWVRIVTGRVTERTQVEEPVQEVSATAALRRQWEAQKKQDPLEKLGVFALRKVVKERGLAWARTDTKAILLEKLHENAARVHQ